jgi:transposase InsO family protein
VHVAVTDHPTSAWTAQQLRNAFPHDETPSYLLHDRDAAFAAAAGTIAAMQIEDAVTAPRSPWQNAYVERFIGSIRRECLDHVIILSESGAPARGHRLRRVLHASTNTSKPRQRFADATARDTAGGWPHRRAAGRRGLHHRYDRAAA